MNWDRDSRGWPNRGWSRFAEVRPHRWHIQEAGAGSGPRLLFLHGAGASTHSWRDVLPRLVPGHHVMALDLPGQGFTRLGNRMRCGLGAMAERTDTTPNSGSRRHSEVAVTSTVRASTVANR